MSDARCHSCGAAVPDQAQWCSLCFADLRAPAARPEPVSVPAAPLAAAAMPAVHPPAASAIPAVAPPAVAAGLPVQAPGAEPHAAPQPAAVIPAEATWPCPRCQAPVAMSLDACPDCGSSFLAGLSARTNTKLPLLGDVQRFSQGQRLVMGVGVAFAFMLFFFLVVEVFSHVF